MAQKAGLSHPRGDQPRLSPDGTAAAATGRPQVYVGWARQAYVVYEGLTYCRGRLAPLFDRIERIATWRRNGTRLP